MIERTAFVNRMHIGSYEMAALMVPQQLGCLSVPAAETPEQTVGGNLNEQAAVHKADQCFDMGD